MSEDQFELRENHARQSRESTSHGYSVEARCALDQPVAIGDSIYSNKWQRVEFSEGTFGVPIRGKFDDDLNVTGLMRYAGAQALRWWFIACCDRTREGIGIETRLVRHKINLSWSSEGVEAIEATDGMTVIRNEHVRGAEDE